MIERIKYNKGTKRIKNDSWKLGCCCWTSSYFPDLPWQVTSRHMSSIWISNFFSNNQQLTDCLVCVSNNFIFHTHHTPAGKVQKWLGMSYLHLSPTSTKTLTWFELGQAQPKLVVVIVVVSVIIVRVNFTEWLISLNG